MTADQAPKRLVPFAEAAEYAGVPVKTMRRWVSDGLLPAYRIGPRLLQVDLDDVDAMRRRVPAASGKRRDRGHAPGRFTCPTCGDTFDVVRA